MLRTCRAQLAAAELKHVKAMNKLQQQLNQAQQQLQSSPARKQDRDNNSAAQIVALQAQAAQSRAKADDAAAHVSQLQEELNNAQAQATKMEEEKRLLLESVQKLLATNQGLQKELAAMRQVRREGSADAGTCTMASSTGGMGISGVACVKIASISCLTLASGQPCAVHWRLRKILCVAVHMTVVWKLAAVMTKLTGTVIGGCAPGTEADPATGLQARKHDQLHSICLLCSGGHYRRCLCSRYSDRSGTKVVAAESGPLSGMLNPGRRLLRFEAASAAIAPVCQSHVLIVRRCTLRRLPSAAYKGAPACLPCKSNC